ncbi:hypothetical protein ACFFLM_11845 [Deinococcus oregonensis]|uniref:Sensor histidine kinase n=1 Tax=Deinococcus oregonensis TaxID=1805970 RepID=A0ABV6B104_9DEIO
MPRRLLRTLERFSLTLLIFSLALLLGGWYVRVNLERQTVLVQLIEPGNSGINALFGDNGTPIGAPQLAIVPDPPGFLPGRGIHGERLVDATALITHHQHLLQAKTVRYVWTLLSTTVALSALLSGALWRWSVYRLKAPLPV